MTPPSAAPSGVPPAVLPDPAAPGPWWVVCLCAAWCIACRDYRAVFDALARQHPQARFVWVDIEDEEDVVGDLDVQTFPTLLLADGAHARFLGPLLPQAGVLARMLASLQAGGPVAAPVSLQAQDVFGRVRAAHPRA